MEEIRKQKIQDIFGKLLVLIKDERFYKKVFYNI